MAPCIAQFRAAGPAPRDPSAGRASPRCAVRRGVDCVDDVRLARCSRIMRPMAKKIAKKTKPKKRVSKAVTAAAKKKASAAAARAKKPAPAKKAARKVAKKAVARPKVPPPKKATRAAPKRAPASAAKKAAPRTAPKAAPDTFHRRDGAGHLDPKYAADLMAQSGLHEDDGGRAFLKRSNRSKDDLAEALGEEFVQGATSGEADGEESLNQVVEEETGGPFVNSTGGTEFAEGTDASNPETAEREPFPKT